MAKLLKLRRGTTSQHGSFTGAEGEVTVDTDKETLVVHDGSTAGGHPVAAEDMANVSSANILSRISTGAIAGTKLENSGVTAGAYGSSSAIPIVTVDAQGLVTAASTTAIDSTTIANGSASVAVASNGPITSNANHDFSAGIDVTGNITVSGTVDGVDVATRDTLFGGLTSSSGVLTDGVTATTAELNQVVGATSALQTQLDNISVTSGSLTKTFTQNETADITLSQSITSAPVVSATKEVPQSGISTKGNWDVNSTASNYDFHNTAANVTLTPTTTNSFSYPDTGSLIDTYTVSGYTMKISSDGTKMYLLSASNNSVQVYNFQSGYEYDLDYVSIDTGNTLSGLSGIFSVEVNSDGTKVFVNSSTIGYMYTLSTAHDLTTATLASQVTFNNIPNLGNMGTVPVARFNSDGTKMFLASSTYSSIVQINLSTAFDVTTGSYNSVNLVVSNQDSTPFGMDFNTEGSRLVMGGASNNQYYEYTLTTNFDLSTASYNSNGRAVGNNYYIKNGFHY